jgi:NAD(P)-dependent dehydrogenase (short-subunit alcohol dehydrogenase family)
VVIGSSGGIGSAFVEGLLARGVGVVHALSRPGQANPTPGAIAGYIDLQDATSIAAAAACVSSSGPVDLIIVATGLLHNHRVLPEKTYSNISDEALAEYFAVNAIGPALVAKHFLPLLSRNRRTVFACLSARVGSITDNRLGGWYGCRASKAALNMLVKTLSVELARTMPNAVCVALHPGSVDTNLSAPFQRSIAPERLFSAPQAAEHLLHVIDGLTVQQSGGCFAWNGDPIAP